MTDSVQPFASLIERSGRLTSDEIVGLDRAFRETTGIARAWSWAYGGLVKWANNYDYETNWEDVARTAAAMDEIRAAVWSAAIRQAVPGWDDPRRAELDRIWTDVRWKATPERWETAATKVLTGPGPTWGAALAVEAFLLANWVALDPDRALIRPWETVIEAIPGWIPQSHPWPW